MKLELVGLPGVGKTAFARMLDPNPPAPPSGLALLVRGVCGVLLHPYAGLTLARLLWREENPALRRSLFINAWLGTFAKYVSRDLIDQGYMQAVLSALPPDGQIASLIRALPRNTLVVFCEVPADVHAARLFERNRAARQEFGTTESERFVREAPRAYTALREAMHTYAPERMVVVNLMDAGVTERIHNRNRAFSGRSFIKTSWMALLALLYALTRPFRSRGEAVVLMYHAVENSDWKLAVSPEMFERQMAYLACRQWAVPLADVVAYAKGEKKIKKRRVAVSFDDGYRDLLTTILPILERYCVPATVFVPSDLSIETSHDVRARLSLEELKRLAASPLITIGSHARTHRKFTTLTPHETQDEASGSADELQAIVGKRPMLFAYPFGSRSREAERIVREAGYVAAFGITDGLVAPTSSLFALPRVQIDATMSFFLFKLRLSGAVEWNRRILSTLRG